MSSQKDCIPLPYTIRHIQVSDIAEFKELYRTITQTSQNLAMLTHEITDRYIFGLVDEAVHHGLGLIVELNGQLIAWMIKRRDYGETSKHILYGGSIGVHPDFQGQGIGKQLILKFLKEVATNHKDILRVELSVLETNIHAYRLYKKVGFEHEGIIKHGKLCPDGTLKSYFSMAWFNPNFK